MILLRKVQAKIWGQQPYVHAAHLNALPREAGQLCSVSVLLGALLNVHLQHICHIIRTQHFIQQMSPGAEQCAAGGRHSAT